MTSVNHPRARSVAVFTTISGSAPIPRAASSVGTASAALTAALAVARCFAFGEFALLVRCQLGGAAEFAVESRVGAGVRFGTGHAGGYPRGRSRNPCVSRRRPRTRRVDQEVTMPVLTRALGAATGAYRATTIVFPAC